MDACCNILPAEFAIFHSCRPFHLWIWSEICIKRSILFVDLKFEIVIYFMLILYISLESVNIFHILLRKQEEREIWGNYLTKSFIIFICHLILPWWLTFSIWPSKFEVCGMAEALFSLNAPCRTYIWGDSVVLCVC